ncbi:MAG: 3' terminal RNA ribose 2'-O-methyltransferase Hen1 [Candidatus Sumerlaeaceae bacterium]|nr:3' terminal RNA ribose 2'-O-methyltransferase Hen1 [Candidatus Sumerlaeaceae bacterium]
MLLTISTTHSPATDLGYLLHKNPARVHSFEMPFGHAHVFYPVATEDLCTAALVLDVDPVGLVRGKPGSSGEGGLLDQYVNDRPYVASSLMSVALLKVFGTALGGRSKDRPELASMPLPLEVCMAALPCRGGEPVLRRLFEPLGYSLDCEPGVLDPRFPEWGGGRCFKVTLHGHHRLSELLSHLYVLIPVLDDGKHYWVGEDEVDKLLDKGSTWLPSHPDKELIVNRYLRHRTSLTRSALARLVAEDGEETDEETNAGTEEEKLEAPLSLHQQRLNATLAVFRSANARRVLDLGCGEGRLIRLFLEDRAFEEIAGMDVSSRSLQMAVRNLHLDTLPPQKRDRLKLFQGSLMYRDDRLSGYDAAAVVEVIEHLDPPRLAAFERVLFDFARPQTVVVTTPNREYNSLFPTLPAGTMRHKDHRFEWSRPEFQEWAAGIATRFGYSVRFLPVGPEDPALGAPTQMGVFTL